MNNRRDEPRSDGDASLGDWLETLASAIEPSAKAIPESLKRLHELPVHRLTDLVCRDLLAHWKAGRRRGVESYLEVFPELKGRDSLLELIDAEICGCQWQGVNPGSLELPSRFPELASAIGAMIDLLAVEFPEEGAGTRANDVCLPAGLALTSSVPSDETDGVAVMELATGNRLTATRIGEPVTGIVSSELQRRQEAIRNLQHPTLWSTREVRMDSFGRPWAISERLHGSPWIDRMLTAAELQLAGWIEDVLNLMLFLEANHVDASPVSLQSIIVDHYDRVIVPASNFLLPLRCPTFSWGMTAWQFLGGIRAEIQNARASRVGHAARKVSGIIEQLQRKWSFDVVRDANVPAESIQLKYQALSRRLS